MASPTPGGSRLTTTQWLVLTVAAIGFLFDTYELLMLPVIAGPALSEILQLPANNPIVTGWVGRLLWIAALCGGIFGLMGGFLIDRFGRKRIMVISILLYSLSPVAAAFSTELWQFVLFRCTTFVGVCVEFVAAITWLAELFEDKRTRELAIGWTQAFASVGGLLVTGANQLAVVYADVLPAIPVPEPLDAHASWRYTLLTGLVPGVLILLLMPFVPESRIWQEKKRAGTLRRPRFRELFTPQLRRVTLVTTVLSATAYAAAFGALQLTPTRVVPGMPEAKSQREVLKPLQDEAAELNKQLIPARAKVDALAESIPELRDLLDRRASVRRDIRKANEKVAEAAAEAKTLINRDKKAAEALVSAAKSQQAAARASMAPLNVELAKRTTAHPEAKATIEEYEDLLRKLGDNRARQRDPADAIKEMGNVYQFWQEMGGLAGRILLAILIVLVASRRMLLWVFQIPGLILFPLTYFFLFNNYPDMVVYGIFFCGLTTVAQFSYLGEYLPKAFPLHLRGTGGSFATNVGGRMIGTSAAILNTELVAKFFPGNTFLQVAAAAGVIGAGVYLIGFVASIFLPEPKGEEMSEH